MNIYLISQSVNNDYDTYDAAIVVAEDEETAKRIPPSSLVDGLLTTEKDWDLMRGNWTSYPDEIRVRFLGKADEGVERGLILASFNAG